MNKAIVGAVVFLLLAGVGVTALVVVGDPGPPRNAKPEPRADTAAPDTPDRRPAAPPRPARPKRPRDLPVDWPSEWAAIALRVRFRPGAGRFEKHGLLRLDFPYTGKLIGVTRGGGIFSIETVVGKESTDCWIPRDRRNQSVFVFFAEDARAPLVEGKFRIPPALTVEVRTFTGSAGSGRTLRDVQSVQARGTVVAKQATDTFDFRDRSPLGPRGPRNNFVAHFRGTLSVPEQRVVQFAVDSDDASFLLLDGREIASYPGFHGFRGRYVPGTRITLEAGKLYALEFLVLQGGGGFGGRVAWRRVDKTPAGPAYLGVSWGRTRGGGAQLQRLARGGPAERAGCKNGDVVLKIDGKPTATWDALVAAVRSQKAGQRAVYSVKRGRETLDITVIYGVRPGSGRSSAPWESLPASLFVAPPGFAPNMPIIYERK